MAGDTQMRDAAAVEEEHRQYLQGALTEEELDEKYAIELDRKSCYSSIDLFC